MAGCQNVVMEEDRCGALQLSFNARDASGEVTVVTSVNTDPLSLGTDPSARGFPACHATVDFELDGYNGLLGWIQLVGVTTTEEAERIFEIDPLQVFDQVETPFAFYGLSPELFDAPSRSDRSQTLDWLAHTFLCVAPSHPMTKEAMAVVGFTWGFVMKGGEVSIVEPRELDLDTWSRHIGTLSKFYPSWRFIEHRPVGDEPCR